MNSATTFETTTSSPSESLVLGEKIGRLLKGGMVVELTSDLGGGKTTMVKGLARGLGYEHEVTSPTFTISRIYGLPSGHELHHFDFYRLNAKDIVNQELSEIVGQPDAVVAIEWAENAADVLPKSRLRVTIKRQDEKTRHVLVEALGDEYLPVIKGLQG